MANLYDLSAGLVQLIDLYDNAETDEEREQILDMLIETDSDFTKKADAYAKIIRMKKAEAEGFKKEAKRLTDHQKADENLVDRLQTAMLDAMKLTNKTEVPTSIGKWRVQMNPYKCVILDADKVPQEFRTPQPDKIEAGEMLKRFRETGEVFPGVDFKQELGIRFR